MARKPIRRRSKTEDEAPAQAPEAEAAPAPKRARPAPPKGPKGRRRTFEPKVAPKPTPIDAGDAPIPAGLSELDAIAHMDDFDMDALLAGGTSALPEAGTRLTGTVLRVTRDGVHVDVGARAEGWIALKELPEAKPGDQVEAFVVRADDTGVVLSRQLSGEAAEAYLEEAVEQGIPVEGVVTARNSGGYSVQLGVVRAFCPISHIARLPLADPDSVLGQTLPFLVLETGEKVVVSRRRLEERDVEAKATKIRATLSEGDTLDAVVTGVQPWSAFLDHQGVELRLPPREFGWEHVDDLTTRLDKGQRLSVRVVEIDDARDRITVSCKDPTLDPWRTATTAFPPGRVVTGTVVSKVEFGVFVEVAPGLQGLVHASHLARLPDAGQTIEVRIESVDPEARRMALLPGDVDPEAQARNTVGTEVTGEVIEVADAGVAVRLEDGRRAWLPKREVDLDPGTVLAQRFRVGHPVEARVISEDAKRNKVTLSMRAPEADDWRGAAASASPAGGMGTLGDLLGGWKKG